MRMALGATPRGVLRMTLLEGVKVATIGMACGIVSAIALGRAVSSLVFGVNGRDVRTFGGGGGGAGDGDDRGVRDSGAACVTREPAGGAAVRIGGVTPLTITF